jgi:chromate transporter
MKTLRTLFFEFLWLGLITFGGGLAMLPTIRQIALKHHWIEEKDWEEIVTLSQLTPGAIAVNCANLIGYRQRKVWGGLVAVLGIIFAPVLIITLLALGLQVFLEEPLVIKALSGMLIVVFVLFIMSAFQLGKIAWQRWWLIPFSLVSFSVSYLQWLSPLWVMLMALIITLLITLLWRPRT